MKTQILFSLALATAPETKKATPDLMPIVQIDYTSKQEAPDENPPTLIPFQDSTREDPYIGYKDPQGNIKIPAKFRHAQPFNIYGFANVTFYELKSWHKINKEGKRLYEIYFYDNGPDYVRGGFQRCVKDGKFGFAKESTGTVIVEPRFDYVGEFDFNAPITLVCQGCKIVPGCDGCKKPGQPRSDFSKAGWGVIDDQGREVFPCEFDGVTAARKEDAPQAPVKTLTLFKGQKAYEIYRTLSGSYKLVESTETKDALLEKQRAFELRTRPQPPCPTPSKP
jgi:hypothetical protein